MIQLSPLRSSQTPPIRPAVLQIVVSLHDVPQALWHVAKLSLPSASARRIASRFERFTPDPEEGSCVIGTVSSEFLCRFDS